MARQIKLDLEISGEDNKDTETEGKDKIPSEQWSGLVKESEIYSVSGLNYRVKGILEHNDSLINIWVRGEISNLKEHSSGHIYFTLKDEECNLSGVRWKGSGKKLRFRPENGMKILAHGSVRVYAKQGIYQLQVDEIRPDGQGELYLAYLKLKEQLKNEGLFEEIHKKELPYMPAVIGVATSQTGAVLRDIIKVASRRFPNLTIYFAPTQVQGDGAAGSIVSSLRLLDSQPEVEVIIIGRGGGSMEDLWAFNEEPVVRAIFATKCPVISAVGHETDETLSDLVADLRAETPSAAAELAVPDRNELLAEIDSLQEHLLTGIFNLYKWNNEELERLTSSYALRRPFERILENQQDLDDLTERLGKGLKNIMRIKKLGFRGVNDLLESLDPASVLRRGYSVTLSPDEPGRIIDSVKELKAGSGVNILLSDGELTGKIDSVNVLSDPFQHLLQLKRKVNKK